MRSWFLVAATAAGCVATTAPPSHFGSLAPSVARELPAVDLTGGLSAVGLEGAAAVSVPVHPNLVLDGRVQLTPGAVLAAPGVWGRAPLGGRRTRIGLRGGLVVGTGDVGSIVAFDQPFVGPSVHAQVARQLGPQRQPGIVSFTLGTELTVAVDPPATVGGEDFVYSQALWSHADLRAELPVSERAAVVFGAGVDLWHAQWVVPFLDVGLRL